MREKIFFVAGTGTDVGKTYLLERVCELLKERGIEAVKPIISGYEVGQVNDTMRILAALKKEPTLENIDSISPWRFAVPTSPHLAGEEVDFALLTKFCRERIALAKKSNRYLLIEGAGGVMTPINTRYTFSDLIKELKIPTLLVSTNYLGAISHILTAAAIFSTRDRNREYYY